MSQITEHEQKIAQEDVVLQLQRDMILIKDRLDLLENGLYTERKRNAGILRKIRKLREEPEIEELLQALQPETKQDLVQKQESWLANLKPGDSIPEQVFYRQSTQEQSGENK